MAFGYELRESRTRTMGLKPGSASRDFEDRRLGCERRSAPVEKRRANEDAGDG